MIKYYFLNNLIYCTDLLIYCKIALNLVRNVQGYLVKLLYRCLQPPVGAHEGQSNSNFGVHGSEGPVLPEKEDW